MTDRPTPGAGGVKVWDIPTRLVHWLLVAAFALAWWTAETHRLEWHRWAGYAILGLVIFRLYWGLAGGESARFSHFLKGPAAVGRYAGGLFGKDAAPTLGHNPMGGWSVAAMLLAILAIVVPGLFAVDVDAFDGGPLSHLVSFDLGREMARWHEWLFNAALALIALHLVAIAFYLFVKRENLVGAMVTGRKPSAAEGPPLQFAGPVRLLVGIVIAAAATWAISKGFRF